MDLEGLILDIDGVLTVGWEPVPGALEAFARLRRRGLPLRLATNTTSRSREVVAAALEEAGFAVDAADILTAPRATATHLRTHHPDAKVFLLSTGDLSADLGDLHLIDETEAADVVVLGGAGLVYTHDQLNHVFNLLLDGASFVAMHRNLYWRTAAGLELDTGAYVTALEAATGRPAVVMGKPSPAFFAAALEELGTGPAATLMVGDDIENDVLGAQRAGQRGCLGQTGKFRPETLADALSETPDHVIASITRLEPDVLDAPGIGGVGNHDRSDGV